MNPLLPTLASWFPESGEDDLPALHRAVWCGDLVRVRGLLQTGADPDAVAGDGVTPLHLAVYRDNQPMALTLLAAGASVNAEAAHHLTPIHLAAGFGRTGILETLLRDWFNRALDRHGYWGESMTSWMRIHAYAAHAESPSPLTLALEGGHVGCVRLLREAGCPKTPNKLVWTLSPSGPAWMPLASVFEAKAAAARKTGDTRLVAEAETYLAAMSGVAPRISAPSSRPRIARPDALPAVFPGMPAKVHGAWRGTSHGSAEPSFP